MRCVIIESPYAADDPIGLERNLIYLRKALNHSLHCGEAPFASHAIYTQPGVLRDFVVEERKLGIESGFAWWGGAEAIVFYVDRGVSSGMAAAFHRAIRLGKQIELRSFAADPSVNLLVLEQAKEEFEKASTACLSRT